MVHARINKFQLDLVPWKAALDAAEGAERADGGQELGYIQSAPIDRLCSVLWTGLSWDLKHPPPTPKQQKQQIRFHFRNAWNTPAFDRIQ